MQVDLTTVQNLVDDLAARLQRSVAVDDPDVHQLAVSPHYGALDDARLEAILSKRTSDSIVRIARMYLIPNTAEPIRVSANDEFGALPRIVLPLRSPARPTDTCG